ncbi:hypothetical protein Tco_0256863 [Tanacetum coccineum]
MRSSDVGHGRVGKGGSWVLTLDLVVMAKVGALGMNDLIISFRVDGDFEILVRLDIMAFEKLAYRLSTCYPVSEDPEKEPIEEEPLEEPKEKG